MPGGSLLDLRPLGGYSLVEVVSGKEVLVAGRVDESGDIKNDTAANASLAKVVERGWFVCEQQGTFQYVMYWDTLDEMKSYTEERWSNSYVPHEVLAKAHQLMTRGDEKAKVSVRYTMGIARYGKTFYFKIPK